MVVALHLSSVKSEIPNPEYPVRRRKWLAYHGVLYGRDSCRHPILAMELLSDDMG